MSSPYVKLYDGRCYKKLVIQINKPITEGVAKKINYFLDLNEGRKIVFKKNTDITSIIVSLGGSQWLEEN